MWSKKNINKEIHLYAIAEGTGHITRVFYLTDFIKKYYKNYIIFIINTNHDPLIWLYNYLKKKNFKKYHYVIILNQKEIQKFIKEKSYDVILDIRDYNPNEIVQNYCDSKVLCLDNYYKKFKKFDYFYCLPSVKSKKNTKELLQNFLLNPHFANNLKLNPITKQQVLFYTGIQKSQIQKSEYIVEGLKKKFLLKRIIFVDSQDFYTPKEFYKIFLNSYLVVTYPGLLLYESMLLEKEVLVYYVDSKIHNKILNKIEKDCKNYFVEKIKIQNYKFLYFNFKNFTKEIQFNLWTPYKKIINWLKEYDKK